MTVNDKKEATKIARLLKQGKIIIYPTDTIWGIGCDATNAEAVEKIAEIKQREAGKSMLLLADHISLVERYTKTVPDAARNIAEVTVEPITIIYPDAQNLPENVIAEDGSIGIRVSNDAFCKLIIEQLDRPLISSSANFSGEKHPESFSDISKKLIERVDYTAHYRRNEKIKSKPSGIIKVTASNEVSIIRS
jgi:L-threonylcarbamoyladenylate synthase